MARQTLTQTPFLSHQWPRPFTCKLTALGWKNLAISTTTLLYPQYQASFWRDCILKFFTQCLSNLPHPNSFNHAGDWGRAFESILEPQAWQNCHASKQNPPKDLILNVYK